jgi:ABC-type transporter Mla subunit MlaD
MTTPTNHWKLGLFVVVGLVVMLVTLVFLGKETLQTESVAYKSYFDEAITGLEVGSPVKFRGVSVGKVASVDIAPDRRHVEVTYDLGVNVLDRLGLAQKRGEKTRISVPQDLRVQLGTTGVTGVKYIQIDFFESARHPPEQLPFPLPDNYIPATSSTLKNIEESVVRAVDSMPALANELVVVLGRVNRLLEQAESEQIPGKISSTLHNADLAFATLRTQLERVPTEQLSQEARVTMANLNATATKMHKVLDRVDGDRGLLASAQRASDSFGDMAGDAHGLGETLREVRDAAQSIRDLAEALEREPDMLLKGRARAER